MCMPLLGHNPPSGQGAHGDPSSPRSLRVYVPAGHRQSDSCLFPKVPLVDVDGWQAVHAVLPYPPLYVSGGQGVQVSEGSRYVPGAQPVTFTKPESACRPTVSSRPSEPMFTTWYTDVIGSLVPRRNRNSPDVALI